MATSMCAVTITAASLMPAGSGLTVPRLDRVPLDYQLWQGEQAAARVAATLLRAGIADADDWLSAKRNPLYFLKGALDRWLSRNGEAIIREAFPMDLQLSTTLDRYGNDAPGDASRAFLVLEPDSAGYIILGPTLRILDGVHPRLPATFLQFFLGSLNRWVRVYDYRDAQDRVERLKDWYESDPECSKIELPDIPRCMPASAKRRPLSRRAADKLIPTIKDALARQLMELAAELDRSSNNRSRPDVTELISELLIDCGEPLPALLAVFEPHDAIEGCFDEESEGMLEVQPEPNIITPFDGDQEDSVREAFATLSTACETLSCASRLMQIMPGNKSLN